MAEANQFASSRLKVARARQHIGELAAGFDAFLKTDFVKIGFGRDPIVRQYQMRMTPSDPPAELSAMIGDVVHNLRTALDHIIVEMICDKAKLPTFPVGKSIADLKRHPTYQAIAQHFAQPRHTD